MVCRHVPSSLHSHRKKRVRQIKKMAQRGLLDPEKEDPFALFVASTSIRYCYYHETHTVLGNTYGMCVLQVCFVPTGVKGNFPPKFHCILYDTSARFAITA